MPIPKYSLVFSAATRLCTVGTLLAVIGTVPSGQAYAQETAMLVTRQAVDIKASPDSVGRIVARLPAKTPLQQIPGRFGPWVQVRTDKGIVGWLQTLEVSGARMLKAELTAMPPPPTNAAPAPTPQPQVSVTTAMAANAVAAMPRASSPAENALAPGALNPGAALAEKPLSLGAQRLLQVETFRADSESARKFAFQANLELNKLPQPLYKDTLLDPSLNDRGTAGNPSSTLTEFSVDGVKVLLEGRALNADVGLQTYVNQLGRWLSLESPLPNLNWTFAVLDGADAQMQAFPSAHVFLSQSLVRNLSSEAELAGVLALGIAQTVVARSQVAQSSDPASLHTAATDHLAVVLLARTGFNPAVLLQALRHTSANGAGITFLSALRGDDAAVQSRIKGLRQFMGTRFDDYRPKASPSLSQRLASLAASTAQ